MTNLTTFAFILFDVLHTHFTIQNQSNAFFSPAAAAACVVVVVVVVVLALIISVMPIYALTFRIFAVWEWKKGDSTKLNGKKIAAPAAATAVAAMAVAASKMEWNLRLARSLDTNTHVNFVIITINLLRWLLVSLFFSRFFFFFFDFWKLRNLIESVCQSWKLNWWEWMNEKITKKIAFHTPFFLSSIFVLFLQLPKHYFNSLSLCLFGFFFTLSSSSSSFFFISFVGALFFGVLLFEIDFFTAKTETIVLCRLGSFVCRGDYTCRKITQTLSFSLTHADTDFVSVRLSVKI